MAAFEADLQRSILTEPFGDMAETDEADDDTGAAIPPTTLRKPLRPGSARNRADHARWAASALVAAGVPIEAICTLVDLVRPLANAQAIMTFLYERAGRNRSSQGTRVGGVLRMIARYVVQSPPREVEKIRRWAAMLSLH